MLTPLQQQAVAPPSLCPVFDEARWLRVLFTISDTEQWLQEQQVQHLYHLPLKHHKKLLRKSWYLGASTLAHIVERHYYKISRHPATGKFTIDIPYIIAYIRDAFQQQPEPIPQSSNLQRVWDVGEPIGYDDKGNTVSVLTVVSDAAGRIITAFPGYINHPLI